MSIEIFYLSQTFTSEIISATGITLSSPIWHTQVGGLILGLLMLFCIFIFCFVLIYCGSLLTFLPTSWGGIAFQSLMHE